MAEYTIQAHYFTNTLPTGQKATLHLTASTTPDEIRAGLLSGADVGGGAAETVGMKVTDKEGVVLGLNASELGTEGVVHVYLSRVKQVGHEEERKDSLPTLHATLTQLASTLDSLPPPRPQHPSSSFVPRRAITRVSKINPRYLTSHKYTFTEETINQLKTPNFDPWLWQENEMLALFEFMFGELGLIEAFGIEVPTLRRFLQAIKDGYNNNPFHNFRHSFCVSQMMYGMIHTTGLVTDLLPLDKLILLVACIGHDLDHPGFNNAYQINARTDLAIIYNDTSPLEMYHCACLFTILNDPETNILAHLDEATFKEARKGIIKCILATDMAKHGEHISTFKKFADEGFTFSNPEHKLCLLQLVTKCADVSNEVRPPDVADPWVDCLLQEFFEQVDTEKAAGLPFAPFMDREKVTKPGAQIGFIGFVMIPLYELVSRVIPNMDPIVAPVRQALAYYKAEQEKEKTAAAAAALVAPGLKTTTLVSAQ
ncbi:high affinity cGMP-specific 3',5'-cyclic phosphodiesterase 9A-like protein [Phlyctochytrium arcticum]|nr:high affinity cGMP-specific 3',5'-cyclic phosphodiesterase 9A-like protein [Phlyctochytrium arcticum]